MTLTSKSAELLTRLINEAEYEGADGMDEALTKFTNEERGNLVDLKKKGFVETVEEEGGSYWVIFQEPARPLYDAMKGM